MLRSPLYIALVGASLLSLAACDHQPLRENLIMSHYWQRTSSSSALYTRGPKAQQMLNTTIASCVAQLRELRSLGAIRYVMPPDSHDGMYPDHDTPAGSLATYDSPTRTGMMRSEHLDFHDFETCMVHYGWERLEHVPYSVADNAREVYTETILGEKYRSHVGDKGYNMGEPENEYEYLNN